MTGPVTLDPAFVAAKVAATTAIVAQVRAMTAEQIKTCVVMRSNSRAASRHLEHEAAEERAATSALAAVGLLELAERAAVSASLAIPRELATGLSSVLDTAFYARRAILGACLEGLAVTDAHLIARLRNPWSIAITGKAAL